MDSIRTIIKKGILGGSNLEIVPPPPPLTSAEQSEQDDEAEVCVPTTSVFGDEDDAPPLFDTTAASDEVDSTNADGLLDAVSAPEKERVDFTGDK